MPESHHFIPRIYQQGFVDPDTPQGQTPFVHVYNFQAGRWKRRGPRNVAAQQDFYALPGEQREDRYALEHEGLTPVEQEARSIYKHKIARHLALTDEEKGCYAVFVALMMSRVPAFRDRMDQLVAETATMPYQLLRRHNPKLLVRQFRAYERATGHRAPTEADFRLLDEGVIAVRASQGQQLQFMAWWLKETWPALARMRWYFCHATPPARYITSDNPVALRVQHHPEWGYSLYRSDIQVQFPLSSSVGLWACWGPGPDLHIDLPGRLVTADGQEIEVPTEFVRSANLLTLAHADKEIISANPDFPGADVIPHKADLPAFFHYLAQRGGRTDPT